MKRSLTVLSAFLFASAAQAAPNYTNAVLSYMSHDYGGLDGDGFALEGSYDLQKQLHLFGGFTSSETDEFGGSTLEYSTLSAGLGFRHPLKANLDLVPSLAVVRAESEFDTGFGKFKDDDIGFALGLAVVGAPRKDFEWTGGLALHDHLVTDDTILFAGGTYYLAPGMGLVGRIDLGDVDTISIGGRMNF